MSDFYIGYLPKAPHSVARFVWRMVAILVLVVLVLSLAFVFGQGSFAHSTFEFGRFITFEGVIEAQPYPTLLVERPGSQKGNEFSRYLLVASGKHGADGMVSQFDGERVRLEGQLIYRDGETMLEIKPQSISLLDGSPTKQATRELGQVTIRGEIVDSKCHLGVMSPGQGKVHRDCAVRCISGGIPPILLSEDGERYLLVGLDGKALGHDVLREFIAEPIAIEGELSERGDSRMLRIDPQGLRHPSKP